jgi:hypothetical protein
MTRITEPPAATTLYASSMSRKKWLTRSEVQRFYSTRTESYNSFISAAISLGPALVALVAKSLCPAQEKRTIHTTQVQLGNSSFLHCCRLGRPEA